MMSLDGFFFIALAIRILLCMVAVSRWSKLSQFYSGGRSLFPVASFIGHYRCGCCSVGHRMDGWMDGGHNKRMTPTLVCPNGDEDCPNADEGCRSVPMNEE
jgi:hypothetical protein